MFPKCEYCRDFAELIAAGRAVCAIHGSQTRWCGYCGETGPHVDEALFLPQPMHSPDSGWFGSYVMSKERSRQTRKTVMCPSCTRAILDLRHVCGKIIA